MVAIAGLGTAVSLYVFTRARPAPQSAPAIPAASDPAAVSQSSAGTVVQTVNDLERYRLIHEGETVYPDRHVEWKRVHIVFKEDGTEAWADTASVAAAQKGQQAPSSLVLNGHVRLKTGEGATVEGASATYEDSTGLTSIPGPVTFTRGRMSGSGTGSTFERDTGVFRLLADARMTMIADPANPDPVEASAHTLVFNRATKAMQFDTEARITHGNEIMTGDRATLYLSENEQQFRVIELRGHAAVSPAPGKTSEAPDMRAEDIDLAFYEGTQVLQHAVMNREAVMVLVNAEGRRTISGEVINFDTAPDGKTMKGLTATTRVEVRTPAAADVPERVIKAPSLVASGDDRNGLTSAVFSGGVSFVETVRAAAGRTAGSRTGTSQVLVLKLKGQLDAIDQAEFQRDVVFKDGDVHGYGDLGVYFASQGKLTLKPAQETRLARQFPRVVSGDITVDARDVIDVALDTHNLAAKGDVKTVSTASKKTAGQSSSLFAGTDNMLGFAAEFTYDKAKGIGRYTGSRTARALVQQGKDQSVSGLTIEITDETQNLNAAGNVESVFSLTDAAGKALKYVLKGDTMEYKDATRVATYTGAPATMKTPDSDSEAKTIVLTMAKESRALEGLEQRVEAHSKLPEGREVLADAILYESRSDRYTFTGKPGLNVVLRTRDSAGKCSQSTGLYGYIAKGDRAPTWPEERNPAGSQTHEVACSSPLKQ